MLTNPLNPALLAAAPAPAPAVQPPTREPGAFGRELQRAADRAQAEEAAHEPAEAADDTLPSERSTPAPRGAAGTRGPSNKAETRERVEGKQAVADASAATPDRAPDAETSDDKSITDAATGTGTGRPEIAAWLQQLAQLRDPGAQGRATAAAAPGADRRADRATEVLAPALAEPAAEGPAQTLIGQPVAPGDKARSGAQSLLGGASGTAAATTQSLQALQSAGTETRTGFAAPFSEAARAESARVDLAAMPAATPTATPGAASAMAAAATAPTPIAEDRLTPPVGSREFAQALGARVAVFARNGIEQARLQVNPAEMGPIALQLALDGTQLRVDMVADMAATRQMLEQALPTLASSLRDAGLTLTGGGVFQQARDGAADAGQAGGRNTSGDHTEMSAPEPDVPGARTVRLDGLVDTYA